MMNMKNERMTRRTMLELALGGGALLGVGAGIGNAARLRERFHVKNECISELPATMASSPLLAEAWQGLDASMVWDCHVHLAGTGDSGSGIEISPTMNTILYPKRYIQRLFYMNAGCANEAPGQVDVSYVKRMHNLLQGYAPSFKLILLAFDRAYDTTGKALPEKSAFYVPNAYARDVALASPDCFEWACSIHPYRADATDALEQAVSEGARAVKWLPPAMGMDPASPACDAFYRAMAALDVPLITHGGAEKAIHGANMQEYANPLRLRRALEHGVRVVLAHCASHGQAVDLDRGAHGQKVDCFELFLRMLKETGPDARLFGDISAITLRNRPVHVLRTLLENTQWHSRLLFGSDYPLPGIVPLISTKKMVRQGVLDKQWEPQLKALQHRNPLLFDFVLKRHLRSNGCRFADSVFETRRFFDATLRSAEAKTKAVAVGRGSAP